MDPNELQRNDKQEPIDETKRETESIKESKPESEQGGSCDSLNSMPHLEGSDEKEDSDSTTRKNRSFDTPYWNEQINLIFQAECSRVIDDLEKMTGNTEPEHEVRPKSVEQEPGSKKNG